jgi:hypothetical protein
VRQDIISNVFSKETLIPQMINQLLNCNLQHECQLLNFAYHCFSQEDTLIDSRNFRELEVKINLKKKSYNGSIYLKVMTYYVYMLIEGWLIIFSVELLSKKLVGKKKHQYSDFYKEIYPYITYHDHNNY